MSEEGLYRGLTTLQASAFLYETSLFPDRVYTFKHALTHEVAYGSLLQEQRRVLHARIVKALEVLGGDQLIEQVECLAHHALQGEVWNKALAYCRQAGDKAMARSAHREAVGYFEQALSALPHLPEQRDTREQAIDLRLALRTALMPLGDLGRMLAILHEAESLAAALDDPRRLVQVSVFLITHFYCAGAYDQAIAVGQHALTLVPAGGETVPHALVNYNLGMAYRAWGDYRRAIDCFRQTVVALDGVRRYEHFGDIIPPAMVSRANGAWCLAELGMFAEGRAHGEEGFQIAKVVDRPGSLMAASWGLGLVFLYQGDLRRSLPLLERALDICCEVGFRINFPMMAAVLGSAYTLGGRVTDAIPLLTQALEQTTAARVEGLCHLSLGEAHLRAGRLEEAQAYAERGLALVRERQERGNEAYALRLFGDIATHRDRSAVEEAEASYHQALVLAKELGMRPLQAHCHRGLGILYSQTGQAEQARSELTTAIEMYRHMDMRFWLPETKAALAAVEGG
jgi:tetratricopeptide (TPR) repeat protein